MQIPNNPCWSLQTRNVRLSYGVEILADDYFNLLQYTHLTDRRTEL